VTLQLPDHGLVLPRSHARQSSSACMHHDLHCPVCVRDVASLVALRHARWPAVKVGDWVGGEPLGPRPNTAPERSLPLV
jgi:hypothetical protein